MRNMHREAAIWYFFTSPDFFELASQEAEDLVKWFGSLATARGVEGFGRNDQIFDAFKTRARNFHRAAEFARLGEYRLAYDTGQAIAGDVHGTREQPLHSWMTTAEYEEFDTRTERLITYATAIELALQNALWGAKGYFDPDPDFPERRDDDDGFPGDKIEKSYDSNVRFYGSALPWALPDPLPEYTIDKSVACKTGDEVPWTGVWYPSTGLEHHSLTFAIKGFRMQPVYRVIKTSEERRTADWMFPPPQTVAVATTWHPLIPAAPIEEPKELWAKAGEPCPKPGVWRPTDPGAAERFYQAGEPMISLGSAYGITVWRWIADRKPEPWRSV